MTEPSLSSVLPAAAQEAISKEMAEDFRSTLKLPKGVSRHMVARAMDRVLLNKLSLQQVKTEMGLVGSEVAYVTTVLAEFRAWEAANKATQKPAEPAKEQP